MMTTIGTGSARGDGEAPKLNAILADSLRLLRARRAGEALSRLGEIAEPARTAPPVLARVAYGQALLGRFGEAIAACRAVLGAANADAESLGLAGGALTLAHQPIDAHAAFARAAALAPDDRSALLNLAAAARFLGRFAEAEAALDRVIAADPTVWDAWRNRSELRRQTPGRNHVADLEAVLRTRRPPPPGEVQLCYALGKEYEDLGDPARAFAWIDRGARLRRSGMRYDAAADVASLDLIAEVFDADWCAPARADADGQDQRQEGPIFILGLPRTGSTLLERMLGRHAQVQPLGELQSFGAALVDTVKAVGPPPPGGKAGLIRASAAVPPLDVGARYLEAVAPLRDGRPRFIDKLPFNMLYAGLIARALPTARIVHLTRDPVDACWAIYKTLFDEAYPFSYDLRELGAYHNAHRRLAGHWRAALGPRFIEVAYERLVTDPAATVTDLLDRLGLDADPACLSPEGSDAPVMTASASQVRAGVHTGSVGASRAYRDRLAPLIAVLDP